MGAGEEADRIREAALKFVNATTWQECRQTFEAHERELRAREVHEVLAELVWSYSEEAVASRFIKARWAALERCQRLGAAGSYADYEQVAESIEQLVNAVSQEEQREIIEANQHQLWADAAEDLFATLLRQQRGDPEVTATIEACWALAESCRRDGIEAVFADRPSPRTGYVITADVLESLITASSGEEAETLADENSAQRQLLLQMASEAPGEPAELDHETLRTLDAGLRSLTRPQDMAQRAEVCRAALASVPGEQAPLWAFLQLELATALAQIRDGNRAEHLEQAIAGFERALQVYTRQGTPAEWARTRMNLGNVYRDRLRGDRSENLEQAIATYRQAIEVCTSQNLPPEDWARATYNLGVAYIERIHGDRSENLEQAIETLQEALDVFSRQARGAEWTKTLVELAIAYQRRTRGESAQNLELAIAAYEQALTVLTREEMPVEWSAVQHNLASAYLERELGERAWNVERAISLCEQALMVRTRRAAPTEWAQTSHKLAVAYTHRVGGDRGRNLAQAIEIYQEVLAVQTRQDMPVEWARTKMDLAIAHQSLPSGDRSEHLERAIAAYRDALEIFRPSSLPHLCRAAARNLANLYFGEQRWEEAAEAYRDAIEATDNLYQASLLGESKQAELAETSGLYQPAAYALARAKREREAVVELERGRARSLGEALERDRANLERVRGVDGEAYELYQQAAARLRRLQAEELATDLRSTDGGSALSHPALRDLAQQAWDAHATAVARIRSVPGYEEFLAEPGMEDIARVVEPGNPLVYLTTTPSGSLALILSRSDSTADLTVEACRADGFTAGDLHRLLIRHDGGEVVGGYLPGQLADDTMLEASLAELLPLVGERLVDPLAERLRDLGAQGVVLIPTGHLGLLPLHAAHYRVNGRKRCLLDELEVVYAPSARVLLEARRALAARSGGTSTLVGVGNPLPHPRPLRFAETELEEIAALFQDTARALYREEATKDALLEALPEASYVHLACHGVFDSGAPLDSQLQLADGEPLTLRELLDGERFGDARLVVLSACQTAMTDFRRLPDEAVGLPAGCVQAGAPGVIGTLWSVDDLSTALIMTKFYELHLRGEPTAGVPPLPAPAALRRAQVRLRGATVAELGLAERAERRFEATGRQDHEALKAMHWYRANPAAVLFADPYCWAPFVFIGA